MQLKHELWFIYQMKHVMKFHLASLILAIWVELPLRSWVLRMYIRLLAVAAARKVDCR